MLKHLLQTVIGCHLLVLHLTHEYCGTECHHFGVGVFSPNEVSPVRTCVCLLASWSATSRDLWAISCERMMYGAGLGEQLVCAFLYPQIVAV